MAATLAAVAAIGVILVLALPGDDPGPSGHPDPRKARSAAEQEEGPAIAGASQRTPIATVPSSEEGGESVSLKFTDAATGAPVAGVSAYVRRSRLPPLHSRYKSDSQGSVAFSLPAATLGNGAELVARHGDYQEARTNIDPSSSFPLHIALTRSAQLHVSVVSPSGADSPYARVVLSTGGGLTQLPSKRCDERGSLLVSGLAPGALVEISAYDASTGDRARERVILEPGPNSITLVLEESQASDGQEEAILVVSLDDWNPPPYLSVSVRSDAFHYEEFFRQDDALALEVNGQLECLTLPQGDYEVFVEVDGKTLFHRSDVKISGRHLISLSRWSQALEPTYFKVVDPEGRSISGARVHLSEASQTCDSSGVCSFPTPVLETLAHEGAEASVVATGFQPGSVLVQAIPGHVHHITLAKESKPSSLIFRATCEGTDQAEVLQAVLISEGGELRRSIEERIRCGTPTSPLSLPAGPWRIELSFRGQSLVERTYLVPGQTTLVSLDFPSASMLRQSDWCARLAIGPAGSTRLLDYAEREEDLSAGSISILGERLETRCSLDRDEAASIHLLGPGDTDVEVLIVGGVEAPDLASKAVVEETGPGSYLLYGICPGTWFTLVGDQLHSLVISPKARIAVPVPMANPTDGTVERPARIVAADSGSHAVIHDRGFQEDHAFNPAFWGYVQDREARPRATLLVPPGDDFGRLVSTSISCSLRLRYLERDYVGRTRIVLARPDGSAHEVAGLTPIAFSGHVGPGQPAEFIAVPGQHVLIEAQSGFAYLVGVVELQGGSQIVELSPAQGGGG